MKRKISTLLLAGFLGFVMVGCVAAGGDSWQPRDEVERKARGGGCWCNSGYSNPQCHCPCAPWCQ